MVAFLAYPPKRGVWGRFWYILEGAASWSRGYTAAPQGKIVMTRECEHTRDRHLAEMPEVAQALGVAVADS